MEHVPLTTLKEEDTQRLLFLFCWREYYQESNKKEVGLASLVEFGVALASWR